MKYSEELRKEVTVRFLGQLKHRVGIDEVKVHVSGGLSLRDLFRKLAKENLRFQTLLDEEGEGIKPVFLIFINGVDSALLKGSNSALKPGDVVDVVPISHGG